MEYSAYYGPKAWNTSGCEVYPTLTSSDMPPGEGYDSADRAVIAQHVEWLEELGIDAITVDVSNDAPCAFDAGPPNWCLSNPTEVENVQAIKSNVAVLYATMSAAPVAPTPIKIIPFLDGQNLFLLEPDSALVSALEHELEYFNGLMTEYPQLSVIYEGHPLMMIYLGAQPCIPEAPFNDSCDDISSDSKPSTNSILAALEKWKTKYTFRLVGGYFDDQKAFWAPNQNTTGGSPVQLAATHLGTAIPGAPFWSYVDRWHANDGYVYNPTYNVVADNSRVENFAAAVSTAGKISEVWGTPPSTYEPDDSLRNRQTSTGPTIPGATFTQFMKYATVLNPIFLMVHQFNEFQPNGPQYDEGWDANTTDDIEPTNVQPGVGPGSYFNLVETELANYRARSAIFSYTETTQIFTVPSGVTSISIKAWGAGGGVAQGGGPGCNTTGYAGGAGAYVSATLSVTPYEQLTVLVGGGGRAGAPTCAQGAVANGGFGYGGPGHGGDAGGGGCSSILLGSTELLTAGGGGGGAGSNSAARGGGPGGQPNGVSATGPGGGGATQTGTGAPGIGNACSGTSGSGNNGGIGGGASCGWGAGGGGGHFGGGGGGANGQDDGGGGGGSSFVGGPGLSNAYWVTSSGSAAPHSIDADYVAGVASGSGGPGLVVISW
jgi:hypothetical protein